MLNLKGPYDVVVAADTAWKNQAAQIASLLEQGTEEATQQALALQESLDKAEANYKEKKSLYEKLVSANAPSDVNQLFVPASETPADPEAAKPTDTLTLAEFNKLSPQDRLAFAKRNGKISE